MSERPVDTAGEHRHAEELIPWVVNGSATALQRRQLDAHLAACTDCRRELMRQRELQTAIANAPPPVVDDVEHGLQRLMARIDRARDEVEAAPAGTPGRKTRHPAASGLTLWLSAAVLVEAVALALLGIGLVARSDPAPGYVALSQGPDAPRAATIRIVPAPSLRLDELQRLLHTLNLQVVAGPNSVGAYDLAPQAARTAPTTRELQIATLRADPGLRLVEPIDAPGSTGSR
jgi:hypothetical protein